ncbi:GNAT family N-acetyltransferase [Polluticoccus soli]|uniref:GNAT family N-acetyltransferase n=1 Tax=Polluticoccus soli TaxID=3034150 RepID=UPI0023E185CB|nr:GNAT family N-acetyltransferase [Flavipsychrobacter sp. JY13-12]
MFVQTKRTNIRPFVHSDLECLCQLCSSADAMQFIPPHFGPETEKLTEDRLKKYMRHHDAHGISFGYVSNKKGQFIGRAGFYFVPEVNLYELGYSLLPQHWGKGLATEIASGLIDYAFNNLNLDSVCARTISGNESSENVLHKIGFVRLGERMFPLKGKQIFWNYFECYNETNLDFADQQANARFADDWDLSL